MLYYEIQLFLMTAPDEWWRGMFFEALHEIAENTKHKLQVDEETASKMDYIVSAARDAYEAGMYTVEEDKVREDCYYSRVCIPNVEGLSQDIVEDIIESFSQCSYPGTDVRFTGCYSVPA